MKRSFSHGRSRILVIATAVAVLVAAGATLASGAARHQAAQPDLTVFYQATVASEVIGGQNDGSGVGVEGIVGNTAGSIGMLGFATSTTHADIGLEGLVRGPSSTALYGQDLNTNAALPGVGLLGTSSTSVGIKGESLSSTGIGIVATDQTGGQVAQLGINAGPGVLGKSASGTFFTAGVDGESTNQSGNDAAGVFGLNAFGNPALAPVYGVLGYGLQAVSGYTMDPGTSTGGSGVIGGEFGGVGSNAGDFNSGVRGFSSFGVGVLAEADGSVPTTFFYGGGDPVALYAVANSANAGGLGTGVGVYVETQDTSTWGIVSVNTNTGAEIDANGTGSSNLLSMFGTGGDAFFDQSGNEVLSGHITTAGGVLLKVHGHSGHQRVAYAAQSTMPALEDYGEAQLLDGRAYVRIDAALADSTDSGANYLVFVTPEGDSNGVFVTSKTAAGFEVRENRGARDSLPFSYRIVLKPEGISGARLASMSDTTPHRAAPLGSHGRHPAQSAAQLAARGLLTPAQRAQFTKVAAARTARDAMVSKLPGADSKGRLHLGSVIVRPPGQ